MSHPDPYERDFGTPLFKMVRSNAPDTSREAAQRIDTTAKEKLVYSVIESSPHGLTGKEVAQRLNRPFNSISGRLTGLTEKGYIRDTGRRRDGGRVMETC